MGECRPDSTDTKVRFLYIAPAKYVMHSKTQELLASKEFAQLYKAEMGKSGAREFVKHIGSQFETLVEMMHSYDSHTGQHLCNAEDLATYIARKMKLPFSDVVSITMGALVHDVGKIGVHHSIISKAGKLTPGERMIAETHVQIGKTILDRLISPWPLADYAYMHHERLDGTGYPQKLKGDQIPLNVRILAACDVAEALMSNRPYRTPWNLSQTVDYMYENSHHFDMDIVKAIATYKTND
jgi:HD-GYP domain-containing protein (c-di-GMP phosphodiesterase class II)